MKIEDIKKAIIESAKDGDIADVEHYIDRLQRAVSDDNKYFVISAAHEYDGASHTVDCITSEIEVAKNYHDSYGGIIARSI